MEDILRKFYNAIRSNSRVGEYEELLTIIEKEIDRINSNN